MAKFSNCLQIVNAMPQRDQDALLARLDELQAQGLSAKDAQLQAAIDVLAQVEREGQIRKSADRIADTPAFKRWFGDSKVVDADGKPRIMYHGTALTDIRGFRGDRGVAGYFAFDSELANDYADSGYEISQDNGFDEKYGEGAVVYPVYLSAQKIFDARDPEHRKAVGMRYRDGDSFGYGDLERAVPAMKRAGFDAYYDIEYAPSLTPADEVYLQGIAVFEPTQIKSATGNNGEFSRTNPDITKSVDRPQFYSQLQRAIKQVPERLSTMAAPAWKQWLTANAPKLQVKAEEVEWSGIKDYLDLQGKAKLSKDDLAAYLAEGGVKVDEVVMDGGVKWGVYDGDRLVSTHALRSEAKEEADKSGLEYDSIRNPETKYSKYTLPGGENYREVLITLPVKQAEAPKYNSYEEMPTQDLVALLEWNDKDGEYRGADRDALLEIAKLTDDEYEKPGALLQLWNERGASTRIPMGDYGTYQSSHWKGTPNVLAHIRVNDRMAEGDGPYKVTVREHGTTGRRGSSTKTFDTLQAAQDFIQVKKVGGYTTELENLGKEKVLFVEEIQSDWGQDGKKKGFGSFAVERDGDWWNIKDHRGKVIDQQDSEARAKQVAAQMGVPAAPFVTKTEGWLNLALKRIAMMAVEGGYDKVAFVNGDQSAERYDMSKQVDEIAVPMINDDGTRSVRIDPTNGTSIKLMVDKDGVVTGYGAGSTQFSGKTLDEVIGKELADKVMQAKAGAKLSGDGLKVGGEGMKAFYDQIVPQTLNKLLPKLGGEKLGKVDIGSQGDAWGVFDSTDEENAGLYSRHATRAEADAAAAEFDGGVEVRRVTDATTQPGFDVTDKMRETVSKGLPLFSRDRIAPDTPEFMRWFRDSVAVDDSGDPLVLYHGTGNLEGLTEFDSALTGKGVDQLGSGFYFTTDPNEASGYATSVTQNAPAGSTKLGGDQSPGVLPVYLSIQKPLVVNGSSLNDVDIDITPKQAYDILKQAPNIRDMDETPLWDFIDLSRASSITDGMIRKVAEMYTGASLISMENDFFRSDATKFREAVHNVLGYDGVELQFDDRKHFVAWFPEQIKSATGNNGQYDPANPDIRKSADRPWFDDLSKLKVTTNYQLGDLFKSSRKLSWWDRTVGTQYNLAQKNGQFKRVFDAVQTFINDVSAYASRANDKALDILPKLETLKDIGKSPLSAADVKALRDPVFGGTLNYTRDEDGNIVETDDVQQAGVVFTDDELRDMFGLNDKQVGLYRQFRAAVDQSLTDLAISDMVRYLGEDGSGIKDVLMDSGDVEVAAGIVRSHLEGMMRATPARAEVLRNTIEAIDQKAEQAQNLMKRGYAPLSRFGEFTVYVVGANGEQLYFGMFENQRDANKMAREMAEQNPDAQVTTGTMSQESYKLFSGVTPETLALFGESLGLEESGIDPKSEVFQQYLKLAKTNRSAMKRLIQRKGIDGFSEDAGRVLAGFVYSNARQVSTNLHAGEIGRSVASVTDGDVKDAAIRLMEYVQNPREEAQAIRGLMFTQFIGGSIASAMVNMTQPWTMTLPYLSQFGGAAAAAKRMKDALKMVTRGIKNDDELKQALERGEAEGVVSPQEVHQLMAQAQGRGSLQSGDGTKVGDARAKANNFVTKLGLGWGRLFSAAEQFNRRITFIAAYNTARDQGMADPFAFATQAIAETQGVYNKGNKPAWARGAVGGTLFTFKQYSIAYVEFLRRMWGNGAEGKKAVALALGVLFLMSGMQGLPGMDDLDDVVDGFAQRVLGRSFDSKAAKKQFFASILGQSGAEFVMSGISGLPGAPIDVAGRMGLGNLIPGTGLLTKKRDYGRDYLEVVGPAGTLFTNAGTALGAVASGEFRKAGEALAPVAAQNWIKSADMATMGFYRDMKGRKVVDTDGADAFFKALGFQPRAVAQVQDATATQTNLVTQNKLRETEIADKWARGRIERKPELIEDAKQELADWNRKNPDSPIRIEQSQINKRVQEAMKTKAQRVAATAPKEIRQTVRRELERESN